MSVSFEHRIRFHAPLCGIRNDDTASGVVPEIEIRNQQAAPRETPTQEAHDWNILHELLLEVGDHVTELLERNRHSLLEVQEVAIKLAVAIANRVLREKLATNDFPIENLVREVLHKLTPEGPVTVRLHPQDETLIKERLQGKQVSWPREIHFLADPSLERGSCRAESDGLGIVAKLEWQIAEIQQTLLQSLDDAQIERRTTQPDDRGLRRHPDRRETA